MTPVNAVLVLFAAAIVLMAAEVFLPGGVLGVLGVVSMTGAVALGFSIGPLAGLYVLLASVICSSVILFVWVRYFPRSRLGRDMTLDRSGQDFKTVESDASLVGQEGVALSELRPSGFASIGGTRRDVVSDGMLIEKGARVRVSQVEGHRIVVRRVE